MNLLYAIKQFYDKLIEYNIEDKVPEFGELDNIAERCYHKNYKSLTKYITKDLEEDKASELKGMVEEIKEIVKDDKKRN